jgi:cytoskeleton protein RodZ
LEEENFSILPPQVYAVGFVKNYAKVLQLDPQVWVEEFQRLAYPITDYPRPVVKPRPKKKKFKLPVKNLITAAFFLAIVIWSGDLIANYIASHGTTQPPIVYEPGATQPLPPEPKIADKLVLKIEAREKCWLQVKSDGQDQFGATMSPGDSRLFEASQSIYVKAGNAGGIDLFLNDRPLPPLGEVGQVVEKQFDFNSISKE